MRKLYVLGLLAVGSLAAGALTACGEDGSVDDGAQGGAGGDAATGGAASGGTGTGGAGTDGPLIAGTESYDCSAPTGTLPALALAPIAGDFDSPVLVTYAPGEVDRLFVVELGGLIFVLEKNGATWQRQEAPFLDLSSKVTRTGNEQGLLGLAFHPDYAQNGLFYVHYSAAATLPDATEGATILEEYQVSTDANLADPASDRRVLQLAQPAANHNGGTITFGPQGYLYMSLGDGGADSNTAQDVTNWFGSILRIQPEASGDNDYTTPTDNLISVLPTAAPELWSYGFRNPYRMNFDGCTGDLYVGDVGEGTWEEVNLIPLGTAHENYGWPIMEGDECRFGDCDQTGLTLPVAQFNTNGSSIAGGSVYRGSILPALRGTYLYAETGGAKRVYTLSYVDGEVTDAVEVTADVNPSGDNGGETITSIQNGGDGELYLTAFSGNVFQLVLE